MLPVPARQYAMSPGDFSHSTPSVDCCGAATPTTSTGGGGTGHSGSSGTTSDEPVTPQMRADALEEQLRGLSARPHQVEQDEAALLLDPLYLPLLQRGDMLALAYARNRLPLLVDLALGRTRTTEHRRRVVWATEYPAAAARQQQQQQQEEEEQAKRFSFVEAGVSLPSTSPQGPLSQPEGAAAAAVAAAMAYGSGSSAGSSSWRSPASSPPPARATSPSTTTTTTATTAGRSRLDPLRPGHLLSPTHHDATHSRGPPRPTPAPSSGAPQTGGGGDGGPPPPLTRCETSTLANIALMILCGKTAAAREGMLDAQTSTMGPLWDIPTAQSFFARQRHLIEQMGSALADACEKLERVVPVAMAGLEVGGDLTSSDVDDGGDTSEEEHEHQEPVRAEDDGADHKASAAALDGRYTSSQTMDSAPSDEWAPVPHANDNQDDADGNGFHRGSPSPSTSGSTSGGGPAAAAHPTTTSSSLKGVGASGSNRRVTLPPRAPVALPPVVPPAAVSVPTAAEQLLSFSLPVGRDGEPQEDVAVPLEALPAYLDQQCGVIQNTLIMLESLLVAVVMKNAFFTLRVGQSGGTRSPINRALTEEDLDLGREDLYSISRRHRHQHQHHQQQQQQQQQQQLRSSGSGSARASPHSAGGRSSGFSDDDDDEDDSGAHCRGYDSHLASGSGGGGNDGFTSPMSSSGWGRFGGSAPLSPQMRSSAEPSTPPLQFVVEEAMQCFLKLFLSITTIEHQLSRYCRYHDRHHLLCVAAATAAAAQPSRPPDSTAPAAVSSPSGEPAKAVAECPVCHRFFLVEQEVSKRLAQNMTTLKLTVIAIAAHDTDLAEAAIKFMDSKAVGFTAKSTMLLAHVLTPEVLVAHPTDSRGGRALKWILAFVFGGCTSDDVARTQQAREMLCESSDPFSIEDSGVEDSSGGSGGSGSPVGKLGGLPRLRNNGGGVGSDGEAVGSRHGGPLGADAGSLGGEVTFSFGSGSTSSGAQSPGDERSSSRAGGGDGAGGKDPFANTYSGVGLRVEYVLGACFTRCHPLMTVIGCIAESDAYECGTVVAKAVLQYAVTLSHTSARLLRTPLLSARWSTLFTEAMMRGLNELAQLTRSESVLLGSPALSYSGWSSSSSFSGDGARLSDGDDDGEGEGEGGPADGAASKCRKTQTSSTGPARAAARVRRRRASGAAHKDPRDGGRHKHRHHHVTTASGAKGSDPIVAAAVAATAAAGSHHHASGEAAMKKAVATLSAYPQGHSDSIKDFPDDPAFHMPLVVRLPPLTHVYMRKRRYRFRPRPRGAVTGTSPADVAESAHSCTHRRTTALQWGKCVILGARTLHKAGITKVPIPAEHYETLYLQSKRLQGMLSDWLAHGRDGMKDGATLATDACPARLESACPIDLLPALGRAGAHGASPLVDSSGDVSMATTTLHTLPGSSATHRPRLLTPQRDAATMMVGSGGPSPYSSFAGTATTQHTVASPGSASRLADNAKYQAAFAASFCCGKEAADLFRESPHVNVPVHEVLFATFFTIFDAVGDVLLCEEPRLNAIFINELLTLLYEVRLSMLEGRTHVELITAQATRFRSLSGRDMALHGGGDDGVQSGPHDLLFPAEYGIVLERGLRCEAVLARWQDDMSRDPNHPAAGYAPLLHHVYRKLQRYEVPSNEELLISRATLRLLLGVTARDEAGNIHGNVLHVDDLDVEGTRKEDIAPRLGVAASMDAMAGSRDNLQHLLDSEHIDVGVYPTPTQSPWSSRAQSLAGSSENGGSNSGDASDAEGGTASAAAAGGGGVAGRSRSPTRGSPVCAAAGIPLTPMMGEASHHHLKGNYMASDIDVPRPARRPHSIRIVGTAADIRAISQRAPAAWGIPTAVEILKRADTADSLLTIEPALATILRAYEEREFGSGAGDGASSTANSAWGSPTGPAFDGRRAGSGAAPKTASADWDRTASAPAPAATAAAAARQPLYVLHVHLPEAPEPCDGEGAATGTSTADDTSSSSSPAAAAASAAVADGEGSGLAPATAAAVANRSFDTLKPEGDGGGPHGRLWDLRPFVPGAGPTCTAHATRLFPMFPAAPAPSAAAAVAAADQRTSPPPPPPLTHPDVIEAAADKGCPPSSPAQPARRRHHAGDGPVRSPHLALHSVPFTSRRSREVSRSLPTATGDPLRPEGDDCAGGTERVLVADAPALESPPSSGGRRRMSRSASEAAVPGSASPNSSFNLSKMPNARRLLESTSFGSAGGNKSFSFFTNQKQFLFSSDDLDLHDDDAAAEAHEGRGGGGLLPRGGATAPEFSGRPDGFEGRSPPRSPAHGVAAGSESPVPEGRVPVSTETATAAASIVRDFERDRTAGRRPHHAPPPRDPNTPHQIVAPLPRQQQQQHRPSEAALSAAGDSPRSSRDTRAYADDSSTHSEPPHLAMTAPATAAATPTATPTATAASPAAKLAPLLSYDVCSSDDAAAGTAPPPSSRSVSTARPFVSSARVHNNGFPAAAAVVAARGGFSSCPPSSPVTTASPASSTGSAGGCGLVFPTRAVGYYGSIGRQTGQQQRLTSQRSPTTAGNSPIAAAPPAAASHPVNATFAVAAAAAAAASGCLRAVVTPPLSVHSAPLPPTTRGSLPRRKSDTHLSSDNVSDLST